MRTNVLVRDLDLGEVDQFDARRLEVVVDGLPLFQGARVCREAGARVSTNVLVRAFLAD